MAGQDAVHCQSQDSDIVIKGFSVQAGRRIALIL